MAALQKRSQRLPETVHVAVVSAQMAVGRYFYGVHRTYLTRLVRYFVQKGHYFHFVWYGDVQSAYIAVCEYVLYVFYVLYVEYSVRTIAYALACEFLGEIFLGKGIRYVFPYQSVFFHVICLFMRVFLPLRRVFSRSL